MTLPLLAYFLGIREALSVAREEWHDSARGKLLGLLITGELKSWLVDKTAHRVDLPADYWSKHDLDHIVSMDGSISFGPLYRGELQFERSHFLDVLYRHRVASQPKPVVIADTVPRQVPVTGKRRGRSVNTQIDDFWIEACRMIDKGEQAAQDGQGQTQKAFIDAMAEWSRTRMTDPYSRDTVEKKIKSLWKALRGDR